MAQSELWIVMASLVSIVAVCLSLAIALVRVSMRLARFADKSLTHAMAFASEQRELIRMEFDANHQEFLLREARKREEMRINDSRPLSRPIDPSEPEIIVPTETSTLN